MSHKSLVSVIIPAFNAQEYIPETIESILNQSYRNLEVVVVDDGSKDKTADIVRKYESLHYVYQENSGGCAVPRNTGIEKSSGQYLCFIDADDLMMPDRIETQVDFMEHHPDVGLVFSDYRNFNGGGPFPDSHFQTCPNLWSHLKDRNEIVLGKACSSLALENFGIAGSFMVRRSLLRLERGFEPSLKACEDFHFYFRLARHTPVGVINKVGMMRRLHENNMSGNPVKMFSEGIRSRNLLRDGELDASNRMKLEKYIANRKGALARFYADSGMYPQSLRYDWQVLSGPFFWPEARGACRNMVRTVLLAIGYSRGKRPVET